MTDFQVFTLKTTLPEHIDLINTLKNEYLFTPPEVESFDVNVMNVTTNKKHFHTTLELNYRVIEDYYSGPDHGQDISQINEKVNFNIGRLLPTDKIVLDTNKELSLSTILNKVTSITVLKNAFKYASPNDQFVVKARYIGDMTKGAGSWIYKAWHGKSLPLKETNTMVLDGFDSGDYHLNNGISDAQRDTVVETNQATYTTSSKANDVDHLFLAYDIFKKNGDELVKVHSGQPMVVEIVTKDKAVLGTKQ